MEKQPTSPSRQEKPRCLILSPRQQRALQALLRGPVSTLDLPRIAGALNAPDVVMRLRRKGFTIHCTLAGVRTRDGRTAFPGTYSLTPADRELAARLLDAIAVSPDQDRKG